MILKKEEYVDSLTGEIIKETSFKEVKEIKIAFKKNHRFSKTFHIEKPNFTNKTYYYYFYECISRLEMMTNRIVEHGNSMSKNKPINMTEFSEKIGISIKTSSLFFKECAEKGIIRRLDLDGEFFGYFVNPKYVFNGEYIDSILFLMFSDFGLKEYMTGNIKEFEKIAKMNGLNKLAKTKFNKKE